MHTRKQRTIIVASLAFIVIVGLTVGALYLFLGKGSPEDTNTSTDTTINSNDFVTRVQEKLLSTDPATYTATVSPKPAGAVYVEQASLHSSIAVPSAVSLQISPDEGTITEQQLTTLSSTIQTVGEPFGITPLDTSPKGIAMIYTSENSTQCTLEGSVGASEVLLACSDPSSYETIVQTVATLLDIWGASSEHRYITYTSAVSTDGIYAVTLLTFSSDGTTITASPLYKGNSDSWEFVTDTAATSQASGTAGGKVANGDALASLTNDEYYAPLVNEVLYGAE
mgnify:FL=1